MSGGSTDSLYGKLTIRELRLSDPKGVFASSPRIDLDWRPFAFVNNHVDVRSATTPLFTLGRLPELKETPSDPNAPLPARSGYRHRPAEGRPAGAGRAGDGRAAGDDARRQGGISPTAVRR